MSDQIDNNSTTVPVKQPKRILHFSDGTLEEYSESDEDNNTQETVQNNCSELEKSDVNHTWPSWFLAILIKTGTKTLSVCDYIGETLASFFGITTPKYQYELDEYMRLQKEREKATEDEENAKGWMNPSASASTSNGNVHGENKE